MLIVLLEVNFADEKWFTDTFPINRKTITTKAGRLTAINAAPNTTLSDNMALDGIAEALSMISDMIGQGKEINNLLDSVDFLNTADFYNNIAWKRLRDTFER